MDDHMQMLADGGMIDEESEIEHAASIAAAIMAKRRKMYAKGGEINEDGGPILSEGATDSDDSDMSDLDRNAQEDQNHEDQLSFDALRKENYSEPSALEESSNLKILICIVLSTMKKTSTIET